MTDASLLRELCKERGLPQAGGKGDLANRLMEDDALIAAAEASPVATDSPDDDADPTSPVASFNNLNIDNSPSFLFAEKLRQQQMTELAARTEEKLKEQLKEQQVMIDRLCDTVADLGKRFDKLEEQVNKR